MEQKTILLGVTGSIAAYKMANVASLLVKQGHEVHVILTKNASEFITPTTFETITQQKCILDTFDRDFQFDVTHISLAKKADVVCIAPASANIIGKIAHGIADDMLSTTIMACTCPMMFAPAMNTQMYHNPMVRDNMEKLVKYNWHKLEPDSGRLACGDLGEGKLPKEEVIVEHILKHLEENTSIPQENFQKTPSLSEKTIDSATTQDFVGKKILITAGATMEQIDPVRYITNHSTGKMGYALAEEAVSRGAEVVLISGKTNFPPVIGAKFVSVGSAEEMFQAVKHENSWDIVIKAAAVADYRPISISTEKIKKSNDSMTIQLEKTEDILKYLGKHRKQGQYLCGFSMETQDMLQNSRKKLEKKNVDMIIANNLKETGAGFAGDTNIVTIITKDKEIPLAILSKKDVAKEILTQIHHEMNP